MHTNLILLLICLILSLGQLFACFTKHPIDTGNYIVTRKWKDYKYMRQAEKLANCLDALPEEIYAKKVQLKHYWAEQAFKQATKTLDPRDLERIHARRFIECFELVAENKASLFLCPVLPNENSHKFINKYTLLEYEECIRQKNNPYIKSFDLKLPNVGFGSISQNHIE